ncbi:hypothetical protein LCGC14_0776060 [marine sediment metagenome]|uniref:Uncharacterized protein n=2 Tax=root TaxID=1 RepID=A0A831QNA8_9FLAO|nr:hypothetical protein [Pricia sp.]HEA20381.1 hypothetical protein [Pricia antarctica]
MKETQELLMDNHCYPIYRYLGHFEIDQVNEKPLMSIRLSISTVNITPIFPWIVERKIKKDFTIVRYLSQNDKPFKTIFLEFFGVRCTEFSEEYDAKCDEVVLHFNATFDKRIMTDKSQQQKIIDLIA